MTFLPENYDQFTKNNNYMKLQEGENKIRLLTIPLVGWEDWINKKPIRCKLDNKPIPSDPKRPVKLFWSFIIWNYNNEEIQILNITQKSIQNKIQSLSNDADWGLPYYYDIKIYKTGDGMDTEYEINPLPHKETHPAIQEAFEAKRCNLEALFDNSDPFSKEHKHYTEGIFGKKGEVKKPTDNELDELHSILAACSQEYQDEVDNYFKSKGVKIADLDSNTYIRLLTKAKEMRDKFAEMNNQELPF